MLLNYPGAAHYPVDPLRTDLFDEFMESPRGPHSEDLQKVLHRMRWGCVGGRFVLLIVEPGKKWMLGRLADRRGDPITTFPEKTFDNPIDAERHIFRLRWNLLTHPHPQA